MMNETLTGRRFIVQPRGGKFSVDEVRSDGSRAVVAQFSSEAVAVTYRRNLQARADRALLSVPPRARGAAAGETMRESDGQVPPLR
jgi:hypothetical protein